MSQKRPTRPGETHAGLDPFALFSAYHLGLTPEGDARFLNLHQVARLFGASPEDVQEALRRYGMDPDTVLNCGFDAAGAQAEIAVAADRAERRRLAREAYERFLGAERGVRDWAKEVEEDDEALKDDPLFRKK